MPLFSPDASPLDFSIWSRLATAVGSTEPRNRQDLIDRIEGSWDDILDPSYIKKTCSAAWERLQRIVDACGGYLKPAED